MKPALPFRRAPKPLPLALQSDVQL
jgi:hypothetical protein